MKTDRSGVAGTAERWLLAPLSLLLEGGAAMLIIAEVVIVCASVVFRYVLRSPLVWSNEAAQLLLVWLSFLGALLAYRRGSDLQMLFLLDRAGAARPWLEIVADVLVVLFGALLVVTGLPTAQDAAILFSPALGLPMTIFLAAVPVFGAVLILFALGRLLAAGPARTLPALIIGVALAAFIIGIAPVWGPAIRPAVLGILAAAFFLCLLLGISIGIAFGASSALFIALRGGIPPSVLPSRMEAGVEGFLLLAVPLFIMVGALMNVGGISERIIRFLRTLTGHVPGGLGLALVAGMYLFSGISGSKTADMAALGPVLVPYMKRRGYTRGDGVAILSAAAAMGETVPPSIAVILIGSITGLSVGALFAAGLLPALVTAGALGIAVYARARLRRQPVEPRASLREVGRALLGAVAPLMLPVILFGGILGGIATPTEVSGIAVVWGLAMALAYRALRGRQIWQSLVEAAATTGAIMVILSTANVLSWILSNEGIGDALTRWLAAKAHAPTDFLLLTLVLMVVMGAAMEGFPALILFAPLLLPIGTSLGLVPLHYGIVLVVAMGVGVFSPPLGVGLFIACAICQATLEETIREYLPYYLILVVTLLGIAFVPWVTLVVPQALHLSLR